ncbi:phage tail assembly chaperone [Croceibacterium sp. LX-88]|uniref:Phage tail assembly chaperone n=1 Tax=Croceibacterium selenioxidans TaxID=2838833 RepID=A0ABS5W5U5_9SPHN|nr:phage tail assembly chaperone [Croceibacterium selenioxidans]MBT2135115.1 phage tail assembly chaperone [Croceibacterium selenioxidans]
MTQTLAGSALALAGLVPRLLGWRPGEFWNSTPAELAAILAEAGSSEPSPLSRGELDTLMEQDRHG